MSIHSKKKKVQASLPVPGHEFYLMIKDRSSSELERTLQVLSVGLEHIQARAEEHTQGLRACKITSAEHELHIRVTRTLLETRR